MSLLDKMRSGTDSTAMQILLVVIIAAMFFWYNPTTGDQQRTVATVNGTQIRDTSFIPRLQDEMGIKRRGNMSPEQQDLFENEVKQLLIRDEVLRQKAVAMGLTVSGRDKLAVKRKDLRFYNFEADKYDPDMYKEYARNRKEVLEREIETLALVNKLRWLVMSTVDLPESRVAKAYQDNGNKVDVQFIMVDPNDVKAGIDVDAVELDTWMSSNGAKIQDRYDRDFSRLYDFPERLELSVIRLNLEKGGPSADELKEKLSGIRKQIEDGGDFDSLARKWSEDDSALEGGKLSVRRSPTLTEDERTTLTSLEAGSLSDILATERSLFFYRLDRRIPAETLAIETVNKDIALSLVREVRAASESSNLANRIHQEWKSSGQPPSEVLISEGLKLDQTGLVNAMGAGVRGTPDEMVKDGIDLDQGMVLDKVYERTDGGRTVLYIAQVVQTETADMSIYEANKQQAYENQLNQLRSMRWQFWSDAEVALAQVTTPGLPN